MRDLLLQVPPSVCFARWAAVGGHWSEDDDDGGGGGGGGDDYDGLMDMIMMMRGRSAAIEGL